MIRSRDHPSKPSSSRSNPKLLSFFLQSFVMLFVITLFFLFLGIASIFILHICIASQTIHRRRHHRHRSVVVDDDFDAFFSDSTDRGLSTDDILKLPSFNYGSVVNSVSTRDCAVCLDGFRDGENFRVLPICKHVFHATCIDVWLNKSPACPICRARVLEL
ncbi:hypothetical protein ACHQM5_030670 [Ranunculus cassubicifolius]